MSVISLGWAWNQPYPNAISRLCLLVLANASDSNGHGSISTSQLCKELAVSWHEITPVLQAIPACIELSHTPDGVVPQHITFTLRIQQTTTNSLGNQRVVSAQSGDDNLAPHYLLIKQCLPPSMHRIDSSLAPIVAQLLQERLIDGWTSEEIWLAMNTPLPAKIGRLGALVRTRIINNVVLGASNKSVEELRKQKNDAKYLPDHDTKQDSNFERAVKDVRNEHPHWTTREVAQEAMRRIGSVT